METHGKFQKHKLVLLFPFLLTLSACSKMNVADNGNNIPPGLTNLPFMQDGWEAKRGAKPGRLVEIKRNKLTGVDTEGMESKLLKRVASDDVDDSNDDTPLRDSDLMEFEFFDIKSGRSFKYQITKGDLSKASRAVSTGETERISNRKQVSKDDIQRENEIKKSWSNATDNRTRRAIADGFSDTHSIYQSFADYGGCSATVLYASNSMMVATTAAHCVYVNQTTFSSSKLRPRRNGSTSPTWGSWTPYAFGTYPSYRDNNCEGNWRTSCIKRDIALVIASPDAGATAPSGIGWGYRPKSFLDDHNKYRRGYPGCGNGHSPSPCTTNNLYGDGTLSVGSFKNKQSGWHRRCRFSSDVNPGDSGSGLYYYRDGNPYAFAVASAEDTCAQNCTRNRPNHARLHDEIWFDFINSVVP